MTKESAIPKMAREIYSFMEEKYAGVDLSTRDMRRALREVIDRLELYELFYGITETDSLVYFPFEKGYKKKIFSNQRNREKEEKKEARAKSMHASGKQNE